MHENSDINTENTHPGLLPNFCDVRIVFLLILITELFALVLSIAAPTGYINFWDYLAFISILIQWIALTNAALLCQFRHWLNSKPDKFSIPASFFIMLSVSFISALIFLKINHFLFFDDIFSTAEKLGDLFLFRIMAIASRSTQSFYVIFISNVNGGSISLHRLSLKLRLYVRVFVHIFYSIV